jgi:hypothetical protein
MTTGDSPIASNSQHRPSDQVSANTYYYGSLGENPDHQVEVVNSEFIGRLDELDLIGKPATKAGNGHPGALGPVDEPVLLEQIRTGGSYHPAAMRLIGGWALHGCRWSLPGPL